MDFSQICDLIIAICGVVPTVVSVVILVVNIIKNKNWVLVQTMAKEAITTVEAYAKTHPEMTSEDKLNMAVEAVEKSLAAANISVDDALVKKIINYINSLCDFSKQVNYTEETK